MTDMLTASSNGDAFPDPQLHQHAHPSPRREGDLMPSSSHEFPPECEASEDEGRDVLENADVERA